MTNIKLDYSNYEDILIISKALSTPTRLKILHLLSSEERDISQLAGHLNLTEANISAQVKHLEKAGLVTSRYEPGDHGVRKLCKTKVANISITLSEEALNVVTEKLEN